MAATLSAMSAMGFSPVEPRKDAIVVLRRDSASSRGSSHSQTATPRNNSPRPRFTPGTMLHPDSSTPPLTPLPNFPLQSVDEEPNTPSSTVVEFGDLTRAAVPSAAELVESIHRSYSQSQASRSESRSRGKPGSPVDGGEPRERSRSQAAASTRERSQSAPRKLTNVKDPGSEKGLADERINRFLHSMAQQASESELLQENRGLYQRVAALQRTERELLAEVQDLTRKFAALKHHHDRRAKQWSEGLRRKETEYEARIQEMGEHLLDLASTHPLKIPSMLSNEEISAWFEDQDAAWNTWARTFGHQDSNRLTSGLHPLQLQELCDEVKAFVRMSGPTKLPAELLSGGQEAVHTLLNAMLANFICSEILASPFWIFVATSLGTLESPGVITPKPLPAVGLRMDMSNFASVAPARPGPVHVPTPRSPQFPPPLITSLMPSSNSGLSMLGLPLKPDMERLVHMLTDAQEENSRVAAHHWRSQMMRLFAHGGFSLKDVAAAGRNESRRTFVESRLNYARKLKERFLGGAARFLLHDQDSAGIEKLERMLTDMIDDALRFSCRLWSRITPLRLLGYKELESKEFRSSSQLMTLCRAQTPDAAARRRQEKSKDKPSESQSPGSPSERSVIMVVQPAIVTADMTGQGDSEESVGEGVSLVWLRARVMVARPLVRGSPGLPVPNPIPGTGPESVPSSDGFPAQNTPNTSTSPPASVATPSAITEKTVDIQVLPASSYKAPAGAKE